MANPWTVVCQAPLSMGFPRQEYWSRLPFPSPEDLPDLRIEPRSPALQPDSLPSELQGSTTWKALNRLHFYLNEPLLVSIALQPRTLIQRDSEQFIFCSPLSFSVFSCFTYLEPDYSFIEGQIFLSTCSVIKLTKVCRMGSRVS